jgi:pilus assembly protein CpaB
MDRRTRTLVVVGVAILLAALASFGVYRAIQRIPVREVAIPEKYIVVAKESVPVGTMLSKEQVKLAGWPSDSPVAGGFSKEEEVIGRGVTASIVENEPITDSKLAPRESGAGLPPTIPPGMRAMSVRVNDVIGVAGFTVPGTRVDVIVTVRADKETMSRAVVSNVQVLAAGTKIDQQKSKDGQAMPTAVVTLLVTPPDAERLALAANEGQIVLALRNPLDVAPAGTTGVRLVGLMGQPDPKPERVVVQGKPRMVVPPPPPPPAPPKPYTVESIRGAKRTEEVVK